MLSKKLNLHSIMHPGSGKPLDYFMNSEYVVKAGEYISMSFYVYENWQAGPHKAVIHLDSCVYCNDGKGKAGGYDLSHAQWHGPFKNIDEAKKYSLKLKGVKIRKNCGYCMK